MIPSLPGRSSSGAGHGLHRQPTFLRSHTLHRISRSLASKRSLSKPRLHARHRSRGPSHSAISGPNAVPASLISRPRRKPPCGCSFSQPQPRLQKPTKCSGLVQKRLLCCSPIQSWTPSCLVRRLPRRNRCLTSGGHPQPLTSPRCH